MSNKISRRGFLATAAMSGLAAAGNFGPFISAAEAADGKTLNEVTYKLDVSKTPKWIDLTVGGEKQAGIFELKGDDLKICSNEKSGGKRPTRFESKPDSEHFLLVFKRAKP